MDPRILQALHLLHSALGSESTAAAGPSLLPNVMLERPSDLGFVSATDLLTMWLPELQRSGGADPWDALFAASPAPARPLAETRSPPLLGAELPDPSLALAAEQHLLDAAAADAVVDCLFAFIHALGRRDLDAAMAEVALDFHAVEPASATRRGGELDRRGLCQRLEQLLDLPTHTALDISLVRIPEVIGHPCGALIHNTIQLDSRRADGHPADTRLWEAVFLFCANAAGRWQLHSLVLLGEV
jgi:ketosteroid isomerase-like protein